jgi:hypothetical protein
MLIRKETAVGRASRICSSGQQDNRIRRIGVMVGEVDDQIRMRDFPYRVLSAITLSIGQLAASKAPAGGRRRAAMVPEIRSEPFPAGRDLVI